MSNQVDIHETEETVIIKNIKKDLAEREISCDETTAIRNMLIHLLGMVMQLENDIIELKIVHGIEK